MSASPLDPSLAPLPRRPPSGAPHRGGGGGKDGKRTRQIVGADVCGLAKRDAKESNRKNVDDRLGVCVLSRRVKVVGALVNLFF